MRPLAQVRAKNFRSLRDVTVDLQPLNVLVGPNASGKSNFLDVIQFLGDAVREDLRPALERRGGFERVFYRGDPVRPTKIEIGVEAKVTKHASERALDAYTLRFSQGMMPKPEGAVTARAVLRREEDFRFKRTARSGRRLTISGGKFTVYNVHLGERTTPPPFPLGTKSDAPPTVNDASELIVCERDPETGATRMPAIDPDQVRAMEKKLAGKMGLGELWFTGTLGGVP
jgi:AAA ATPase domain